MKVLHVGVFGIALASLIGCNALGLGSKRVDYGAGATQVPALEVPPDLTQPASDERYRVPQGEGVSVTTLSDYSKGEVSVAQDSGTGAGSSEETQAVSPAPAASSVATINASGPAGTASLEAIFDGSKIIVVNDAFDRSWRKAGLAIERAGLVVEDKDRARGIYFLRPAEVEKGWLDKLAFWESSEDTGRRYRVNVKDGGTACEVSVTDQDGATDATSGKMLEAIYKNISE